MSRDLLFHLFGDFYTYCKDSHGMDDHKHSDFLPTSHLTLPRPIGAPEEPGELAWLVSNFGIQKATELGLSCFILVYLGLSWFIMVCHHGLLSWFIMVHRGSSWFIMFYHVLSWFIMFYHVLSCFITIIIIIIIIISLK